MSNYNEEKQTILCSLVKKYNVNTVYIPNTTNNILIFNLVNKLPTQTEVVFMENEIIYTHKNLQITSYSFNEVGYLVKINTTNYQALFADIALNTQEINSIKNQITPLTNLLIMDKMTNFIYNVLVESEFFSDLEYIFVRNNQTDNIQQNLYDTTTYGYLQVK